MRTDRCNSKKRDVKMGTATDISKQQRASTNNVFTCFCQMCTQASSLSKRWRCVEKTVGISLPNPLRKPVKFIEMFNPKVVYYHLLCRGAGGGRKKL